MKICCTCKKEKPLTSFYRSKGQPDGRHISCASCCKETYRKHYVKKGRERTPLKHKICSCCKKKLPNTTKYFFLKTSTWTTLDGIKKSKKTTRAMCKKCQGSNATKRHRKKRCIELNCSPKDYKKTVYKLIGEQKKSLHKDFPYAFRPELTYMQSMYIIHRVRAGYKWISYEQWLIDKKKRKKQAMLSYNSDYKDLPQGYDFYKDLPKGVYYKILREREPTDGVLANQLGYKLNEISPEILSVKRITNKIKKFILKNSN